MLNAAQESESFADVGESAQDAKAPAARGGLIVNEDNSHFFLYRPAEKMNVAGMNEFVDQYAGSQVKRFLFCVNGMKVNYDTKAKGWEPLWTNVDNPLEHETQWVRHVTKVHEDGIDPFAVFIARCREINISPWITMRMNIFTWSEELGHFSHSSFWTQHPQYWRLRPQRSTLDYGLAPVRERAMALISELLERYDMDGLELDWMRMPEHFAPGEEAKGRELLIEFMADVRRLADQWAKKRGHPIRIGVRVPVEPETAAAMGLDAVAWAKAGSIDQLTPAPFLDGDFDIPVEQWRQLLGPAASSVTIAPCLESDNRGNPDLGKETQRWVHNKIEALRGFAASMIDRGADQIYLFNFFDPLHGSSSQVSMQEYLDMIHQAGRLETIIDKPRRHIVTSRDVLAPGEQYDAKLPIILTGTTPVRFDLHIGPQPMAGKVHLRAMLADRAGVAEAALTAHVNGSPCKPIADLNKLGRISSKVRIMQFNVPLSTTLRGYNAIKLSLAGETEQKVLWVEIYIAP